MKEGIIGILGGMGPEATADLFNKIVKNTEAGKDQSHLRVVMDSNSKIPDRTPAMLGTGESPLPMMTETAKNPLEGGGGLYRNPLRLSPLFHRGTEGSDRHSRDLHYRRGGKGNGKACSGYKTNGAHPNDGDY